MHEAIIVRLDLWGSANRRDDGAMNTRNHPPVLANLGPLAQLRAGRLTERVLRLLIGLWLYGVAIALMIEGALGASPWDVFHLGVSRHLPISFGMVMILAAFGVLLAWIPLRQMPAEYAGRSEKHDRILDVVGFEAAKRIEIFRENADGPRLLALHELGVVVRERMIVHHQKTVSFQKRYRAPRGKTRRRHS